MSTLQDARLDRQLELAKWIALIAMAFDHIGLLFYDLVDYHLFRAIGRLTWPLLAWIIAIRLVQKPARVGGYLKRLIIWGLISQPVFWLAFYAKPAEFTVFAAMLNILFTITIGVGLFALMERWRTHPTFPNQLFIIVTGALLLVLSSWPYGVDYKICGALMIPLIALAVRRSLPISALVAGGLGSITAASVMFRPEDPVMGAIVFLGPLAGGLIGWLCLRQGMWVPRLPRWFFYFYYPAHLAVLIALRMTVFAPGSMR
jgi:hypothetical protein